ncbi:hypothetical protein PHLCEN_2v13648 [Hermanssonia centrifuga]|uniref:Uncharacterized protein n=1 Tax=Hermanssonia centrifuga TaxID=98765 RepID=A0A2R6NDQ2_9APHY|nr:hypothetical protein PHLCEN_2v13648 [Hermanssonia centrifuga]
MWVGLRGQTAFLASGQDYLSQILIGMSQSPGNKKRFGIPVGARDLELTPDNGSQLHNVEQIQRVLIEIHRQPSKLEYLRSIASRQGRPGLNWALQSRAMCS